MTVITKQHRCTILTNIVKQTFGERYKNLLTETTDLASRLYVSWLGDRLGYMKKLPKDWFNYGGRTIIVQTVEATRAGGIKMLAPVTRSWRLDGCTWPNSYTMIETENMVPISDTLPVARGLGYIMAVVPAAEKEIAAHNSKVLAIKKEVTTLIEEVKPLILGAKSLEKLRKQWPQVEPFLPEELKNPVKNNLPVVRVDYINRLIAEAMAKAPAKAVRKGGKK